MWTGSAVGVQVQRDNSQAGERGILVRSSGTTTVTLSQWDDNRFGLPAADFPDYSQEALFAHWVETQGQPWTDANASHVPVLGGMSTGGDVCPPVNNLGQLQFSSPNEAWLSLSFVVKEDAVGAPGSLVDTAAGGPKNPSGHIFSYGVEGSIGLIPEFIDGNRVEYRRQQMGLGGPNPKPAITALDWGMGMIAETPGGSDPDLQPRRDLFFFTLTNAWLSGSALSATASSSSIYPLSSQVLYAMIWDGSSWSDPFVAMEEDDLVESDVTFTEIDAISVHAPDFPIAGYVPPADPNASLIRRLLFSLDDMASNSTEGMNEILVTQPATPVAVRGATLRVIDVDNPSTDAPMTEKLGLTETGANGEPDKVGGLCGRDPDEHSRVSRYIGYAVAGGDIPSDVGVSIFRHAAEGDLLFDDVLLTAHGADMSSYMIPLVTFQLEYWAVASNGTGYRITQEYTPAVDVNVVEQTAEYELALTNLDAIQTAPGYPGVQLRVRAVTGGLDGQGVVRFRDDLSWQSWVTLR